MSDSGRTIRVGTRGSQLAMWQARHVAGRIAELPGAPPVELITIKTEGDRITDVPLSSVQGKSFFTKEIEAALLDQRIDLAVHSLKDLATQMPESLDLGAVLKREDPRDLLISRNRFDLKRLPQGARVGTSSLRRRAFLLRLRPDLEILDLRGNVPTRIRKLEEGQFDAIVLATAGVKRLGLAEQISIPIPTEQLLPAVGQGAVAVQVREGDTETLHWVKPLDDTDTRCAVSAERALLHELEGGCQIPVGALAIIEDGLLKLAATVCDISGQPVIDGQLEGATGRHTEIGQALARDLLARGGEAILNKIRQRTVEDSG